MKKTLVALAVLAVSGAALAQSSVTLYGRVDAALASWETKVNGVGLKQTGIQNGSAAGLTTSRWGMKGTEDLGGGLKANFVLENRFNVDDGTQNGSTRMFHGNSYVSLAGGFGEVKLGRTYTSFDDARAVGASSNVFDSAFTAYGDVFGLGGDYTSRGNNQVRFDSANFGGFSGSVSYAFGEDKTALLGASNITSLNLMYAAGPLTAAYGYQAEKATSGAKNTYNVLGGAYNFGVASLSAGYGTRKLDTTGSKDTEYQLGVAAPMGAVTLSAGYAHSKNELAGVNLTGKGWGLGATYALSKRTTLYTGYKNTKVNTTGTLTENTLLSAGVRHNF